MTGIGNDHNMIVNDAVDVMAPLRKEATLRGTPRRDLILLDWDMPRKDGREVLAEMSRQDPALERIPVVPLTTSSAERGVIRSCDAHANAHIRKPADLDQFPEVVRSIGEFRFTIAKLPMET